MRAATALLMWGGKIEIVSTADVESNAFMQLCSRIRDKEPGYESYSLHTMTFDDALADGFYRRICYVNGEQWTEEGEKDWRAKIIQEHGVSASAELFCQPMGAGGVGWFGRDSLMVIDSLNELGTKPPKVLRTIRFWDFAATKPSPQNPDPDWTVGARVLELDNGDYVIDDIVRLRDAPGEVHQAMLEVARADGRDVEVGTWQDPGAGGKSDAASKGRDLTGYVFHSPKASKSKLTFAKPWASLAQQKRVYVMRRPWTSELVDELVKFPNGKHDDQIDAISGAFELFALNAYNREWASAWKPEDW
jgi:predicted phage terminase large subunit-like protein